MTSCYVGGLLVGNLSEDAAREDGPAIAQLAREQVLLGCRHLEGELGSDFEVQSLSWTVVPTGIDSAYLMLTIVGKG